MRKLVASLTIASLLCLVSIGALAYDKELKDRFTFHEDLLVGKTVVKKGEYLVKYNTQTGEVSFLEGDKVVAVVKGTIKMHDKKFDQDALITIKTPAGDKLIGLRPGGHHEEISITETDAEMIENWLILIGGY
jgi:hypothetical protein